jgi:hypothetical protein
MDKDKEIFSSIQMPEVKHYKIDFDKVNSIEDIKDILSILGLTFSDQGNPANLQQAKRLLKVEVVFPSMTLRNSEGA